MSRASTRTSSKETAEPTAAKPQITASTKSQSTKSGKSSGDGMDREEMISIAAYFRAEHCGFDGSDPIADWLAAEAEIDAMLEGDKQFNVH
jgi:Protein of unknown function (DUF2934)